jgi:predicted transcriptional regulator
MVRTDVGDRSRLNFYLDNQVFDSLRSLALQRNTTYSELIRQACREYLVREGSKTAEENQTIKGIQAHD